MNDFLSLINLAASLITLGGMIQKIISSLKSKNDRRNPDKKRDR